LTIEHEADLIALVKAKGVDGLTARDTAAALFDTATPTRAQKEKARRKLVRLEADGVLVCIEHDGVGAYFLAERGCTGVHES
jgi:SHS2 domain-containing protein